MGVLMPAGGTRFMRHCLSLAGTPRLKGLTLACQAPRAVARRYEHTMICNVAAPAPSLPLLQATRRNAVAVALARHSVRTPRSSCFLQKTLLVRTPRLRRRRPSHRLAAITSSPILHTHHSTRRGGFPRLQAREECAAPTRVNVVRSSPSQPVLPKSPGGAPFWVRTAKLLPSRG